jgi:hypothetical protein
MNATFFRCASVAVAAAILLVPGRASAQVLINLGGPPFNGNDNVQAYFSADTDTVHQSDPLALPTWGSAGIGPYVGYAIPSVPGPPAAPFYPGQLTPAEPFYSGPYTSNFTDGGSPPTTATSTISAGPTGGTSVASAYVNTSFNLNEPNNPPGYAYEQIDFAVDYGEFGMLTGGPGTQSFLVSGVATGPGSYAQLGAALTYWWTPSTTTWSVGTGALWTNLGTLDYSWSQVGPGAFSATVLPTGTLSATPTGSLEGVLEITGDIFVAGDPADFQVNSVPEPASWLLFGIGLAILGMWPRLRRRAMAV